MDLPASALQATVAPVTHGEAGNVEEFRIGFEEISADSGVVHGLIWPLLTEDADQEEAAEDVAAVLERCGLGRVELIDQLTYIPRDPEQGSPLFMDREHSLVQVTVPQSGQAGLTQLH